MEYASPKPVELTPDEQEKFALVKQYFVGHSFGSGDWEPVADAMESLVESLLKRGAIPEKRLKLFTDPAFAEVGNKSRKQIFESNGTSGDEIFRHPHFFEHLKYFIKGPNLPKPVIEGLCKILNDELGTSGMVFDQYRKFARDSVRQFKLDRIDAAHEFFRLGVEIGMQVEDARTLRDAAKSTR